jgi:cytochrome o ubiquinol oxidase subunit III
MQEHEHYPDTHHDVYGKTLFGFWLYLLTDFILFGTLFATFVVLRQDNSSFFSHHFVLVQSLLLLTCSFTVAMAGALAHRKEKKKAILLFGATFLLGFAFLILQLRQFTQLLSAGHTWKTSAFFSAFFTLVGMHALHVVFGLLWILVLLLPFFKEEINMLHLRRLTCLRMFWQFLNVVWVFIFTIVYWRG